MLRRFSVSLLIRLCAFAISTTLFLLTINATILNKDVIKSWLRETNTYAKLADLSIQNELAKLPENNFITPDVTKAAFTKTFTPDYVQQQVDKVIDSIYNWLEGKGSEISFSLPLNEKRDEFAAELSKLIEPQVAALPICTSLLVNPQIAQCRPSLVNSFTASQTIVAQGLSQTNALKEPITENEVLNTTAAQESDPIFQNLPAFTQVVRWLLIILPLTVLVSIATLFVITSERLLTFKQLSKRVFIDALIFAIITAVIAFFSPQALSMLIGGAAISDAILPFAQKAIISITTFGLLLEGIATVASGSLWFWLSMLIYKKQQQREQSTEDSSLHKN